MAIPEEKTIENGSLVRIDSKSNPHHGKIGVVQWSEAFSGQMWVSIEKGAEHVIFRPEELKLVDAAELAHSLNSREPANPVRRAGLMSSFFNDGVGIQVKFGDRAVVQNSVSKRSGPGF